MSKEEAVKLVAESAIMAPVVDCLVSGNFAAVNEPVAEGEIVVGGATDFEKALYTVSGKIADEHNAMVNEACGQDNVSSDGYVNLYHKRQIYETIAGLLWLSIDARILEAKKSNDVGIRNGYQIVIPGKEEIIAREAAKLKLYKVLCKALS